MRLDYNLAVYENNRVFVGCQAVLTGTLSEYSHEIVGDDKWLSGLVFQYLSAGAGVLELEHPDPNRTTLEEEHKLHGAWQAYCAAEEREAAWLARWTFSNVLPSRRRGAMSRMGSPFYATIPDQDMRLAVVSIARGGDEPTFFARDIISKQIKTPIPTLRASCQRVDSSAQIVLPEGISRAEEAYLPGLPYFEVPPVWLPRPTLEHSVKGTYNLTGRKLIAVEAADASGTTCAGLFPEVFLRCRSIPEELILIFLNAHSVGIRYLQEEIAKVCDVPITIVVGMLHAGLDLHWYLRGPGMFDGGKMRHLTNG